MKINVKAMPGAKKAFVKKIDDSSFQVAVKELPTQGQANDAVIDALADFLKIGSSRVKIISGWSSRQKIIEIS